MASDQRGDQVTEISEHECNLVPFPFRCSFIAGVASLTSALTIAGGLIGWWLSREQGFLGWQAAAFAAVVCWQGGLLGMIVASRFRGRNIGIGAVIGIVFRLLLPIGVMAVSLAQGSKMVRAGLLESFVICYQVALVVEARWVILRALFDVPSKTIPGHPGTPQADREKR
ncbi:MAG: hypothetical protein ACKPEY_04700 [Planctomycetota bacterium]